MLSSSRNSDLWTVRSVSGALCNLDFLFLLEDDKPRIDAAATTADSAAAVAVILVSALFLRVLAADLLPQGSMRERLGARFVRWLMGLIKFNWNDLVEISFWVIWESSQPSSSGLILVHRRAHQTQCSPVGVIESREPHTNTRPIQTNTCSHTKEDGLAYTLSSRTPFLGGVPRTPPRQTWVPSNGSGK